MKGYIQVKTQDDVETLLDSIAGFHDSMGKELHITNRGYVTEDQSMAMSHSYDIQLLIQSQHKPFAMELVFCDVSELLMGSPDGYYGATGQIKHFRGHTEQIEIQMNFDSRLIIHSSALYYKACPERLGPKCFLNTEVPSDKSIPAKQIEGNWRQCSDCCDAWEEDPANIFSTCPGCRKVTELENN